MLGAVFAWGLYSVLLKKIDSSLSQLATLEVMIFFGLIFIFPFYLLESLNNSFLSCINGKSFSYDQATKPALAFWAIWSSPDTLVPAPINTFHAATTDCSELNIPATSAFINGDTFLSILSRSYFNIKGIRNPIIEQTNKCVKNDIKLKANGTVVEFDAKINEENMEKFLSTVLNP